MHRLKLSLAAFLATFLVVWCVGGCAPKEEPAPTETKEERRLKEKEMMQREMRNE